MHRKIVMHQNLFSNMKMKQLIWRLVLPLTIIFFGTVTKWWYVLPVDAPETMMIGFPLAFVSDGWHTSMSFQIFVFELMFDFLVYFLFWFLLITIINQYLAPIKITKILTGILWILSTIIVAFAIWVASFPEQTFKMKRDWDMKVMETGYKLIWTHQEKPDFSKYIPNKK